MKIMPDSSDQLQNQRRFAKPDSLAFKASYAQIRRKKRKASNQVTQRYFTDYSASLNSYDEFSTPITLSGDFDIEFKATLPDTVDNKYLGPNTDEAGKGGLFGVDADGSVIIRFNNTWYSLGTVPIDNQIHLLRLVRSGSDISASIDGTLIGTQSFITGDWVVNTIARSAGSSGFGYADTAPADLKIWDDGDRDTGTLVVDMPLDEPPEAPERINRADPLNNATRFNQPASQTEIYTLFTNVSPNEWRNADNTKILLVAGT